MFPDPSTADEDGLIGVGLDLSPRTLISAYREGIFPWSEDPISWWSPDPRGVFPLSAFVASRRLRRKMLSGAFHFTRNACFEAVMRGCAEPSEKRGESWIGPAIIEAYLRLHQMGHAHSVECWQGDLLVGGIYGVHLGGLFAGESMFSRVSDGSKMALVSLIDHLRDRGFVLFDVQQTNDHTRSLGAIDIPRGQYLQQLQHALTIDAHF
jgi:leucyl/phenylalanyl-tRNA--protein transferase